MHFRLSLRSSFVLTLTAAAAMLTPGTLAQTATAQPDMYYLLGSNQTLTLIQPTIGTMKGKSKLGGFGGVKVVTEIPGERATIRLKAGDAQTFVINVQAYAGVQGAL